MTLLPFVPECHSYRKITENFVAGLMRSGVSVHPPDSWEFADMIVCPPDAVHASRHRLNPGNSVVYTMFEATRLREEWVNSLNKVQAVLVPSSWGASCFSASGVNVPIYVVPLGFNPSVYYRKYSLSSAPRNSGEPFVFSTVFSHETGAHRKNNEALLKAFNELNLPDAELWIRATRPKDEIQNPRIRWFTEHLSEVAYADWIRRSDCGVFPSRGEGFGFCPLEFSACGIPTLVPRFAGLTEHVPYGLVGELPGELATAVFDNRQNGLWFEVDPEGLKREMLNVYNNWHESEVKAELASKAVQQLTWEHSVCRLLTVLKKVGIA